MKTALKPLILMGLLAPLTFCARAQDGPSLVTPALKAPPALPPVATLSDEQIRDLGKGVAFPYEILSRVLGAAITKNGSIDYGFIKGNNDLDIYVRAVGLAEMKNFPVFQDKDDQGKTVLDQRQPLAFYINAYNALFLKAVTQAYPVGSVSQIPDFYTKPRLVAGEQIGLDALKKKITTLDPRAIFVLLDGTRSGPRPLKSAVLGYVLGEDLNAAIKAFVNDPVRVPAPSRLTNQVTVSPWLQQVDELFKPKSARRKGDGIRQLLTSYTSNGASQRYFGAGAYEIKYLPAQTELNQATNALNIGEGTLGGG